MTAPTHTIPRDLLEGIRTGNDQLLASGFHEIYPSLVQDATTELDDLPGASRMVEQAVLRVITERDRISDADSLDRALHTAVHEGVVRERSRRAALHRFEHNEGVTAHREPRPASKPADADEVWERIQRSRQAERTSAQTHASVNKESKHLAAVHMAQVMDRRRSRWTIPALVLGLVAVSAAFLGISRIDSRPTEQSILLSLAAPDARLLGAGDGQIGTMVLTDETVVKLGAGSKIRLAKGLGTSLRALALNGSGSFSVPAADAPLEIRANGIAFSVDSGRLDIRADEGQPTLLRVHGGQVRISTGDSGWTVTPGESFIVTGTGTIRPATPLEEAEALGWLEGRFTASGSVRDVVMAMRRWYGADIGIGDKSIVDRPAQASGSLNSLSEVMKTLEKSANVEAVWVNGRMILYK